MTETNIALLSRLVESSPVIVLVCFFFIGLLLLGAHLALRGIL